MANINISVVGACVSRDVFNRNFVPHYKEYYQCPNVAWQSSIISLMSPSLTLSEEEVKMTAEVGVHQYNNMLRDHSKVFLQEIIDIKPQYIVVDFYADMRYGVVQTGERFVTNNPNSFRKTAFYKEKKFDRSLRFPTDEKEYRSLWEESFERFYQYVKKHLPETKIILNCFRYANAYSNERGETVLFSPKKYHFLESESKIFDKLYQYIQKHYDVETIDLRENEYLSDIHYPFGLAPWHYERAYHQDVFHELNKISLKNLLKTTETSSSS